MAESVSIANEALGHLGSSLITALSDTTKEARYCNQFIEAVRQRLLRMHPWGFAKKRKHSTISWITVTGAADNGAGLIRITATAHGLATGDRVYIRDIVGTTEANNYWYVTVISSSTFDLVDSTFSNTYTSDGELVLVPAHTWGFKHALPSDYLRAVSVEDEIEFAVEAGYLLCNEETIDYTYIYDCQDETLFDPLFAMSFGLLLAWQIAPVLTQSEQMRSTLFQEFNRVVAKAKMTSSVEHSAEAIVADDIVDSRRSYWASLPRDPGT